MDFTVHPLRGVNDIEFGMQASEVRKIIGEKPEEFRRHDEIYPSDHFVEEGVFGYYDPEGHLEALEFAEPARVILGAANILDLSFGQAATLMKQIDPEVVVDRDMVTSKRLCLSIWSSAGFKDDAELVEAFWVGRTGYYDSLDSTDS
jgi:hypothetical protein